MVNTIWITNVYIFTHSNQYKIFNIFSENNSGKLSPITQSIPTLPNSWQDHIYNIKESLTIILKEEEIVQKLLRGMRNIAERCDDVLKNIDELKGIKSYDYPSLNLFSNSVINYYRSANEIK